jgi:hypothetical protein
VWKQGEAHEINPSLLLSMGGQTLTRNSLWSRWLFALLAFTLVVVFLGYQWDATYSLDIGAVKADDDLYVTGFYQRESSAADDYRWTGPHASVRFPGLGSGQTWTLSLYASGYRPEGQPLPQVEVLLNHQHVASFVAEDGMAEYVFPIPASMIDWSGNVLAEIEPEVFSPEHDSRQLGLLISRISIEPVGGGVVLPSPLTLLVLLASVLLLFLYLRWMGASCSLSVWCSLPLVVTLGFVTALHRQYLTYVSLLVLALLAGAAVVAVVLHWLLAKLAGRFQWPALKPWQSKPVLGVLLLALACNLALAPTPGFVGDLGIYMLWAWKLTTGGLHTAYLPHPLVEPINYLPLIPYLFSFVGSLYQRLFASGFPLPLAQTTLLFYSMMKLPMIAANLATGGIIFAFLRRRTSQRVALLSMTVYLFNPAILFDSAYGGQADAIHSLFAVLAVVLILEKRVVGAWLSIALAALSKPQGALFLPLILFLTWRQLGTRAVLKGLITAGVTVILIFSPFFFRGTGDSLVGYLLSIGHLDIPGLPAYTTMGAHNLWWVLGLGAEVGDTAGPLSQLPAFGTLITPRTIGLTLLGLLYTLGLWRLWRGRDETAVPVVAAFLGFACYMSLTQVHETYAFSVLPFLALALYTQRRWRMIYVILSLTFLANMCLHDAALLDMLGVLEQEWLTEPLKYANALVNLGVLVYWISGFVLGKRAGRAPRFEDVEERQAA